MLNVWTSIRKSKAGHVVKRLKSLKWISPYIIALILGIALMPAAAKAAYITRGYRAIGGEILIPLLIILILNIGNEIKTVAKEGWWK